MRRRFFRLIQKNATARVTAAPGKSGVEMRGPALALAETEIVSLVAAAAPEGATVSGEKPHDAPACNPEQVKETAALKPFCGVMVTVAAPLWPDATVKAVGAMATEKSGAGASPFTVRL